MSIDSRVREIVLTSGDMHSYENRESTPPSRPFVMRAPILRVQALYKATCREQNANLPGYWQVIDAVPVMLTVPLTPGSVTPANVAVTITVEGVALTQVAKPVGVIGTSTGSDVVQVKELADSVGGVQPAGTSIDVPNCWALLPDAWFIVILFGNTEIPVGSQFVELPLPQPNMAEQNSKRANALKYIAFMFKNLQDFTPAYSPVSIRP